jgi:hypothetical protein
VTKGVTWGTERGSIENLDVGLRFFKLILARYTHHGTRNRRMDPAAQPMQATLRGRRKKTVRQGAQARLSAIVDNGPPLIPSVFIASPVAAMVYRQERF